MVTELRNNRRTGQIHYRPTFSKLGHNYTLEDPEQPDIGLHLLPEQSVQKTDDCYPTFENGFSTCTWITVIILNFRTDRSGQTVQTRSDCS